MKNIDKIIYMQQKAWETLREEINKTMIPEKYFENIQTIETVGNIIKNKFRA